MKEHPKYISLHVDVGFKKMFGEPNKKFLIAFLNSILSKSVGPINDLSYLNTEQIGETPDSKKMIFDIYCLTDQGQHIIVELQMGRQSYYGERAVSYVSRLISNLAEKGVRRYSVPPIYSINLLNFRMPVFKDKNEFLWEVQLKDQRNNVFLPKIKFIFIELCTFARLFKESEFSEEIHRWLYIINNMGDDKLQDCPFEEPLYQDFFEQGLYNNMTDMEKKEYEKSILEYQDVIDTIEFEREKALAEGEAKAKLAMAKSMIQKGIDLATILAITGLTAQEIS